MIIFAPVSASAFRFSRIFSFVTPVHRNLSWLPVTRTIKLDEEIGLDSGSVVELRQYHPVEKVIGRFRRGETVNTEVLPCRSTLLLATADNKPGLSIEGCDYAIVRDVAGKSLKISLLAFPGSTERVLEIEGYLNSRAVDRTLRRASNLFSPYNQVTAKAAFESSFVLNDISKGGYLDIALN